MDNIKRIVNEVYLNIKRNQHLSRDVLEIYCHTAEIKSPILIDDSNDNDFIVTQIKEVSESMGTTCIDVNASDYTTEDLPGDDITQILIKLLDSFDGNLQLAQKGVVILNNMDNLFAKNANGERTILKNELPSFIHGGKYPIMYNGKQVIFDTTNVTFIGRGDFSEIGEDKMELGHYKYGSKYLGGFQEVYKARNTENVKKKVLTLNN